MAPNREKRPARKLATQRRVNGALVRELRIEMEFSVRELANKARIDPHTITDWENGRTVLAQVAKIKDVAAALDVPWTDLDLDHGKDQPPKARAASASEVAVVSTSARHAQARRVAEWDDSEIEHKVNVEA